MMGDTSRIVHVNGQHQYQRCEERRIVWTSAWGQSFGAKDTEVWTEEWWSVSGPTPCDCENPQ